MKWFLLIALIGFLGIILTGIVVDDPQTIKDTPILILGFFGLIIFVAGMPLWLAFSILKMKINVNPKQKQEKS